MKCTIQEVKDLRGLIMLVQAADEPAVVCDGEDECLVAMRPRVFEDIVFNVERMKREGWATAHL